jgi:hypothetical protein
MRSGPSLGSLQLSVVLRLRGVGHAGHWPWKPEDLSSVDDLADNQLAASGQVSSCF